MSNYNVHDEIIEAIKYASQRTPLIIMTGGLGPTQDDVTIGAITSYFKDELVFNDTAFGHIKQILDRSNRCPSDLHRQQCFLPSSAQLLQNNRGIAPGIWIKKGDLTLLSMPGVPSEMKGIMTDHGLAKIQALAPDFHVIHHIIRTAGKGETYLASLIQEIVDDFPKELSVAYLPSLASVKLRITAKGKNLITLEKLRQKFIPKIENRVAEWTYDIGDKELQEVIGDLCIKHQLKIGTAESCTGGHIAHLLTQVPGCSAYFEGAIISYSNEVKHKTLNVKTLTLTKEGAVSEATVREMVQGGISQLGIDICVAVSGIAGPGGGSPEKPVGTVWIAVGDRDKTVTHKWQLAKGREINIKQTSVLALNQLRLFIERCRNNDTL